MLSDYAIKSETVKSHKLSAPESITIQIEITCSAVVNQNPL